ncbi:hypothetical protein [Phenylobacterium sp.]|jgi:hypothetical protein|uniref:hypothetical protein n=1 Tax=Phenylobacterium sp. TaxID=1871053 RepID=UPI002E2EFF50|nr:hypothetical protein [Phenylobacterium sp.]HEX2561555.1 hypothetical protein [Phenylobacterium sp.]
MFLTAMAAGLILAANAPQTGEVIAAPGGGSVQAGKPADEAKAKPKCHYVSVTGGRAKRRVCSDNPERDAAAAAGVRAPSSTMGASQQGNINTN